jgi:hypothetical protein
MATGKRDERRWVKYNLQNTNAVSEYSNTDYKMRHTYRTNPYPIPVISWCIQVALFDFFSYNLTFLRLCLHAHAVSYQRSCQDQPGENKLHFKPCNKVDKGYHHSLGVENINVAAATNGYQSKYN